MAMKLILEERTLTDLDFVRLQRLVRDHAAGWEESPLEGVLDAARCVPPRHVEPDVVTMNSRVLVGHFDRAEGASELTLSYPPEARPADGFVSVLSPIGTALLGLRIGDIARWKTPHGQEKSARVMALLFQPEANGHYTV
jgi:regulator of nucleoside diphosphate kinase